MISPVPGWGAPEICRRADSTSPMRESRTPCTAEKPAAGSGRHAIQGHISPKSRKDRQTACPFLLLCLGQEAPEGLEGRG